MFGTYQEAIEILREIQRCELERDYNYGEKNARCIEGCIMALQDALDKEITQFENHYRKEIETDGKLQGH